MGEDGQVTTTRATVGILVFDEVEVLDACGPFEVFSVAARARVRAAAGLGVDDPGPGGVALVAVDPSGTAVARGGLRLQADHALEDAPPLDLLVVAGGVVDAVAADPRVLAWTAERARTTAYVASICTGAFVLAAAGVLAPGTAVTTHHEDQADLARRHPGLDVVPDRRWVRADERTWTSGGIAAGIDLALHLVDVLAGRPGLGAATARQMEYPLEPAGIDGRRRATGRGVS